MLDDNRFNEVRDLGEVSMGRPDALASFIEEAADRFPADKYALTLFDHGAATPTATSTPARPAPPR